MNLLSGLRRLLGGPEPAPAGDSSFARVQPSEEERIEAMLAIVADNNKQSVEMANHLMALERNVRARRQRQQQRRENA